jgi:hypothetical protein
MIKFFDFNYFSIIMLSSKSYQFIFLFSISIFLSFSLIFFSFFSSYSESSNILCLEFKIVSLIQFYMGHQHIEHSLKYQLISLIFHQIFVLFFIFPTKLIYYNSIRYFYEMDQIFIKKLIAFKMSFY